LALKISLVLVVKAVALTLIWVFFVRGLDSQVTDLSMEDAFRFDHFQSYSHGGQHHD
jgi:hypothetical protein